MDALITKQGDLYETVQIKKPTIVEIFRVEENAAFERSKTITTIPKLLRTNCLRDG